MFLFIFICLLVYFLFIFEGFLSIIINVVKGIGFIIVYIFEELYKYMTMGRKISKEEKKKNAEMIERKKRMVAQMEQFKNTKYENNMIKGIFNKIRELRFKYPQADSKLFDEYQNNIWDLSITELDELENKIAKSHQYNVKHNGIEKPQYNYSDIEGLIPLEEIKEEPIYIKLFRKDKYYIAVIQNTVNGKIIMYQSIKYLAIMDLCNNIVNQIDSIRIAKRNIKATDIDNMVQYSVNNDIKMIEDSKSINTILQQINKKFN